MKLLKNADDLDVLIEEYGHVFPEDWDYEDIKNFCARYVYTNIDDVMESLENDEWKRRISLLRNWAWFAL